MAARRGAASVVARRGWVTLLGLVLVLAGCTYSNQERGLFPPAHASAPPTPAWTPQVPNPKLPVLGEAVWTTGDGTGVTVRFAVHAVRRIAGATVLDWSVTPLAAPGWARGDLLPSGVDLGLTRDGEGDVNVLLLDPADAKAYRPISHKKYDVFNHCLCSPLWVAQLFVLRLGETRLLQTTYPQLPAAVHYVDVALMNTLPFVHVPVTGIGQVPYAASATDLARPPGPSRPLSRRLVFRSPGARIRGAQAISIAAVQRAAGYTSLQWVLESLADKPRFWSMPYGPPVSTSLPDSLPVLDPISASGPRLRPAGGRSVLRATWLSNRGQSGRYYECLCSDLGLWTSSLRAAGGRVILVTTFPPLPTRVRSVDVILPRVGTLKDLPVTQAPDSAARLGPLVTEPSGTWTYSTVKPPHGWAASEWPTPLPDSTQLRDYTQGSEDVLNPGW